MSFTGPRVRNYILAFLRKDFRSGGGVPLIVTSATVELEFTMRLRERGVSTVPSNVKRRFRELRSEWHEEQKSPGQNESILARYVGIVEIVRLEHSPMRVRLEQADRESLNLPRLPSDLSQPLEPTPQDE